MNNVQLSNSKVLSTYPTQQGALKRNNWGFHLVAEFWGAPFELLADSSIVFKNLKLSLNNNGKEVKGIYYQFQPFGVSAQVNSGFSNIYIHTWPENGYAAIDIITSSKNEAYKILENLKKLFSPKHFYIIEIPRGITEEDWEET